jgi:hypothetical protein
MKINAELTFPNNLKDKPILCLACKKYDITMAILEGAFSKGTGWALVTLEGPKTDLIEILGYFKSQGIDVKSTLKFI